MIDYLPMMGHLVRTQLVKEVGKNGDWGLVQEARGPSTQSCGSALSYPSPRNVQEEVQSYPYPRNVEEEVQSFRWGQSFH